MNPHSASCVRCRPILVGVIWLTALSVASAASFRGIGDIVGGVYDSVAYGISSDGNVVVGHSTGTQGGEAFGWRNGKFKALGDLDGGRFYSLSRAASADGSVIVGAGNWLDEQQAARWSNGLILGLGDLPGGLFRSEATAVSADGSVVVGLTSVDSGISEYPIGWEAFRWEGGTMTGIGRLPETNYSRAFGVSADGRVIVGDSASFFGDGRGEAFRWEAGTMVGLGFLRAEGTRYSTATAVSGNGSVIVGSANSATGTREAFRWENGVMMGLGRASNGKYFTNADAVSADGSVIVGWGQSMSVGETAAFVWDALHGARRLDEVLLDDFAIDVGGWRLLQATGVSADGRTIVGYGRNPNGKTEGWIAEIPEPTTTSLAILCMACLLCARFRGVGR